MEDEMNEEEEIKVNKIECSELKAIYDEYIKEESRYIAWYNDQVARCFKNKNLKELT